MRGGKEEGTLSWFLVKLACGHILPLTVSLYEDGCMFRSGSFPLWLVSFFSQFLLRQQT